MCCTWSTFSRRGWRDTFNMHSSAGTVWSGLTWRALITNCAAQTHVYLLQNSNIFLAQQYYSKTETTLTTMKILWSALLHRATITTQQPFYGPLSRTTRVSWYQKEDSPTHHPDHTTFISFFHLPRSIASSLLKLRAWQSFCTTYLHVLFGLPLGLEPSTSYSIHFFTQKHKIIQTPILHLWIVIIWSSIWQLIHSQLHSQNHNCSIYTIAHISYHGPSIMFCIITLAWTYLQ